LKGAKMSVVIAENESRQDVWVDVKELTPEYARYLLDSCVYDRQRKLKDPQIKKYSRDIINGNFAVSEIRLIHYNGQIYMTNGQHRCEAVILANKAITVTMLHLVARTEKELHKDYIHADSGIIRTTGDKLGASGIADILSLNLFKITKIGSATQAVINAFDYKQTNKRINSTDELLSALWCWADYGKVYLDTISKGDSKMQKLLLRKSIMAVGMITFRYKPALADQFWSAVALDDGLKKDTPQKKLVDYLKSTTPAGIPIKHQALRAAYCWNAFMDGREVKSLLVPKAWEMQPIRIEGTPFDGTELAEMKIREESLKN
jgi:hypothetical protein